MALAILLIVFAGSMIAARPRCRADDPRPKNASPIVFHEVAAQAGISFRFATAREASMTCPRSWEAGWRFSMPMATACSTSTSAMADRSSRPRASRSALPALS